MAAEDGQMKKRCRKRDVLSCCQLAVAVSICVVIEISVVFFDSAAAVNDNCRRTTARTWTGDHPRIGTAIG